MRSRSRPRVDSSGASDGDGDGDGGVEGSSTAPVVRKQHQQQHSSSNQWLHTTGDVAAGMLMLLPSVWLWTRIPSAAVQKELAWAVVLGGATFLATASIIPTVSQYTLKAGLFGKDLCKTGTSRQDKLVPESLGLACGIMFIVAIIVGQLVITQSTARQADLNAALLSVCFMVLLGFIDDVVDLRWRYKLILPTIASLPLLCQYSGITAVVMPKPVRGLVQALHASPTLGPLVGYVVGIDGESAGAIVDLGALYYVYMLLLAVFCTNSINIYAGVNGLEAGQAFVIACAVLFTNVLELTRAETSTDHPHLFSATLLVPFIATVAALLRMNWYPSRVFVGDTFCYFAGMTLAVSGILGHFSKTLLLFLVPQILNFLYSLPQVMKWWPCPRHRLPWYNPETGLVEPSQFTFHDGVHPEGAACSDACKHRDNCTLICLALRILGPLHERTLVRVLLGFQALCCVVGLVFRYRLVSFMYDTVH